MNTYTTLRSNFRHDGKHVPFGEPVELSDAKAKPLLALGAIQPASTAVSAGLSGRLAVRQEALCGSNTLPAHIEIAPGMTVWLGDVVSAAFAETSFSSVDSWNQLDDDARDALLQAQIERLRSVAAGAASTGTSTTQPMTPERGQSEDGTGKEQPGGGESPAAAVTDQVRADNGDPATIVPAPAPDKLVALQEKTAAKKAITKKAITKKPARTGKTK